MNGSDGSAAANMAEAVAGPIPCIQYAATKRTVSIVIVHCCSFLSKTLSSWPVVTEIGPRTLSTCAGRSNNHYELSPIKVALHYEAERMQQRAATACSDC